MSETQIEDPPKKHRSRRTGLAKLEWHEERANHYSALASRHARAAGQMRRMARELGVEIT